MMTARVNEAYARPDAPSRDARAIEYDLFARMTRRLSAAWAQRKENHAALVRALHDNGTMWRTLAIDVADEGNSLPAPLRAQLFYLYKFTTVHSKNVLDGKASADALVDINTAVMRGLRGNGGSK
ncbi:flagellar biosynthesis regulator FlaF [Pseudorhodobacter turbinis]|nr:flagellar biosynthesis regulator FlaF [Pseudorhodobacter turbinis]